MGSQAIIRQLALQDGAQNRGENRGEHRVHRRSSEHHDGVHPEDGKRVEVRNDDADDHREGITRENGGDEGDDNREDDVLAGLVVAHHLASTVTRMPHTSAPTISDAMFTSGVAFNMGIWLTTPTSRPMTTDW